MQAILRVEELRGKLQHYSDILDQDEKALKDQTL
jgi:hypothetical protein